MTAQTTLINGNEYSYASIEIWIGGVPYGASFKSINYNDSVEFGKVRGAGNRRVRGTTAGEYSAQGDGEIYLRDFNVLIGALGIASKGLRIGMSDVRVPIGVSYGEPGLPVVTDILVGARITGLDSSNSEGTDASVRRVTFGDITEIHWAGVGRLVTPGIFENIG